MVNLTPDPGFEPVILQTNEPTVAKAVVAVATTLGAGIATSVADGRVTWVEIVINILGAIAAGAAVWATTNERK